MEVRLKKVRTGVPGLSLPTRGSAGAACYDVVAVKIDEIEPGKVKVYLGFASEIEPGYKGYIVPRSSFTHKGWVMQNSPAQIDEDYRGEWMLKFEAIPMMIASKMYYPEFPYKVGERCAQIYFSKVEPPEVTVIWKEDLSETERGNGGFGSTGDVKFD